MGDMMRLPKKIEDCIKNADIIKNTVGCTESKVFLIKNSKENLYLKVGREDVFKLYKKLRWLDGILPVPRVICYVNEDNLHWLLMTEVKGTDLSQIEWLNKPIENIKLLANSLRLLHSIDIGDCPFDMTLETSIKEAENNVICGIVNECDFEEKYMGLSAKDLLKILKSKLPKDEDLVLTHGDFCLPNILGEDGILSGFIDLDRFGIACKYKDIALCIRSIEHNFSTKEYYNIFFEEYGLLDPDWDRIEFYILLDEFF